MSTLYIPVGISGAGKSTYFSKLKHVEKVSMDEIRRELGDINDQTNNFIVVRTALQKLKDLLNEDKDVYFDATNLTLRAIKKLIKCAPEGTHISIILFEDSKNWQLCRARVQNDIEKGIDRARTFDVEINGEPLQKTMSEKYIALIENEAFWNLVQNGQIFVGLA